ncbi:unnamed protein product [Musa hybrid cultivar]
MGRSSTRLPSFCLNRMSHGVRVRSPPLEPKPPPSPESGQLHHHGNAKQPGDGAEEEALLGRRIMIVVDSSPESKTALRWALSHSVQSNDSIILVDVVRPPKHGESEQSGKERDPKIYELLHSMRSVCHARKPEVNMLCSSFLHRRVLQCQRNQSTASFQVQVELSLVEATERGPAIVEEVRKQDASLLIMGQKKRSLTWRLVMMWAGRKVGGSVADYCVQNATCMAMAVRRKSRRGGGGYLITTKRHKDFWLLA